MGQAFFKPVSGSVQTAILRSGTVLPFRVDRFIGAAIVAKFKGALNRYGKLVDLYLTSGRAP